MFRMTELSERYDGVKKHPFLLASENGKKLIKKVKTRARVDTALGVTELAGAAGALHFHDQVATAASHLSQGMEQSPEVAAVLLGGLGLFALGSSIHRRIQHHHLKWMKSHPEQAQQEASKEAEKKASKKGEKWIADNYYGRRRGSDNDGYWDGWFWGWYWGSMDWDNDHYHCAPHHGSQHGVPAVPANPDVPHHGGGGHGLMDVGGDLHHLGDQATAFGAGMLADGGHALEGLKDAAGNAASGLGDALGNAASGAGDGLHHLGDALTNAGGGFHMPNIDLPSWDMPNIDLPDWDMPDWDMPDWDINI